MLDTETGKNQWFYLKPVLGRRKIHYSELFSCKNVKLLLLVLALFPCACLCAKQQKRQTHLVGLPLLIFNFQLRGMLVVDTAIARRLYFTISTLPSVRIGLIKYKLISFEPIAVM